MLDCFESMSQKTKPVLKIESDDFSPSGSSGNNCLRKLFFNVAPEDWFTTTTQSMFHSIFHFESQENEESFFICRFLVTAEHQANNDTNS